MSISNTAMSRMINKDLVVNVDDDDIYVITRTGQRELLDTNKITKRIRELVNMKPKIKHINASEIMLKISSGISTNISTYDIDEYAANLSASLSLKNPYYIQIASRIAISNHQKKTKRSFIDKMRDAYLRKVNGKISPILDSSFYKFVERHQDMIEQIIDYKRDFLMDFFGFRTFQKIYSIKIDDKPIERPQDAFMRIAVALHYETDVSEERLEFVMGKIKETYLLISSKQYTQASPMYFNAGTKKPQFSSCFLLGSEDSLEGIKNTEFDIARISKWAGGIGVHINEWRGDGAIIRGTNGISNGPVPFLRMYNNTIRAFNQGGKRLGSCAVYIMPHHPNIMEFVKLKRNDGAEEHRARDLFFAVWVPDIFMERVRDNADWSTFDPNETVDLSNYYDEYGDKAYSNKYLELENLGLSKKTYKARDLWNEIFETNRQKGMPYICFSDNANRQSNQKNIGVIKSSNLCAEIYEYSDDKETAVCNLCSINLEACVEDRVLDVNDPAYDPEHVLNHEFPVNPLFNFTKLKETAKLAVYNLNQIIDRTFYPTEKTKISNMRHRPIGVGVQGQANAYMKLRFPFESESAIKLNKMIYETLLFACYTASTELSKDIYKAAVDECKNTGSYTHKVYLPPPNYGEDMITYTNYKDIPKTIGSYESMLWNGGSPAYNGKFCWELSGNSKGNANIKPSTMYDWETLRSHIQTYGMRNSLCVALMPTASTSQLLGNNECFEPFTSNIYKRKTIVGEYIIINKYLINDLHNMGIWSEDIKDYIMQLEGSIQSIEGIPDELKLLYKTSWEINQDVLVQQACDRQPFIDQGMSLNLYISNLNISHFTKLMFQAWKNGLKTGKYYIHSRPAAMPQKFTISHDKQERMKSAILANKSKAFLEPLIDVCDLCSA